LKGQAEAIAHGAITIINAIATGKGAAMGVNLWTKAKVKLTEEPSVVKTSISSDPTENTTLAEKTVLRVLCHFNLQNQYGAKVETWSNIPIARGLKSSSVAANAISLATSAAIGKRIDKMTLLNLAVDAAIDAKVTITGAFDDACASYLGGIVVTDNTQRKIVRSIKVEDELEVLFHVPKAKAYTISSDVKRMKILAPQVEIAYREALKGNLWVALTLNGLI
jgi:shikimate kinase